MAGMRSKLVAGVVLVAALGVHGVNGGIPTGAQEPGTCAQPYPPVGVVRTGSGFSEATPPGFEVPTGATTGMADAALVLLGGPGSEQLDVVLADGPVTLTEPGLALASSVLGDLDGDGTTDLWVGGGPPGGDGSPFFRPERGWVVPGATAAGDHEVSTVGIEVPAGLPWSTPSRSGELGLFTGDALDAAWLVLPSDDVLAVGPGGDARGVAPLQDGPGVPLGRLDLPPVGTPSVISAASTASGGQGDRLYVTTDATTTAYGGPLRLSPSSQVASIDTGSAQYLSYSVNDRSGGLTVVWRTDDPCGGVPQPIAGPGTPGAPPPVRAAPAFTG